MVTRRKPSKALAKPDASSFADRLEQRLRAELDRIERALPADSVLKLTGMSRTDDDPPAAHIDESDRITPRVGDTEAKRDYPRIYMLGFGPAPSGAPPMTVGDVCAFVRAQAADMASDEAARLAAALALVPTKLRAAVTERAVERWQWATVMGGQLEGFDLLWALRWMAQASTMTNLTDLRPLTEAIEPWPTDIALHDAVEWLRDRLEEKTRGAGRRFEEASRRDDAAYGPRPHSVLMKYGDGYVYTQGHHLAWLYSAFAAVERDQREPAIKLPSNRHAHTVTAMLANPPPWGENTTKWNSARIKDTHFELSWSGKRAGSQLRLLPDDGTLDQELARSMLAELGPEGLRDWLTLHRIAGDQGTTGAFRWSWAEHKARTRYENRIAASTATDAEQAHAVRKRLWRLKQAELWADATTSDGKRGRVRVGPHGLIDIGAELLSADDRPIVVAGQINPALYKGAQLDASKPHYTLLPERALMLADHELALAALLTHTFRNADDKGRVKLKASTLWEYARVDERRRRDRKRWPDVRKQLERWLATLTKELDFDWSGGGGGPDALYTVSAAPWFRDRLEHKVPPLLAAPSTQSVPRDGPELAAMMEARGLSLQAIAAAVGASKATVMRKRNSPQPLPPEWLPCLARQGWRLG